MAKPSRAVSNGSPGSASAGLHFRQFPRLPFRSALTRTFAHVVTKWNVSTLARFTVLTFLGVGVICASIADGLRAFDPMRPTTFDGGGTRARIALAQRLLAADPARADDAVAVARNALIDDPLAPGALTWLARAREREGDLSAAAELMTLANRVDPRDLTSGLWLLDRDLRDARVASALRRFDILSRGQMPEVLSRLTPALAPILTSAAYRSGFVALLRADPPWRAFWLRQIVSRSQTFDGLTALFSELQDGADAPTISELKLYLTRLTDAGLFEPAYRVWVRSLSSDPAGRAGALFNAGFDRPLTNLPFDWQFAPAREVLATVDAGPGGRVLNVAFFGGGVASEQVSHLMKLAPGIYRFSGRERSRGLRNERGLRWRITCADSARETLAVTDALIGETSWRFFGVVFAVPETTCPFQTLVLELPARAPLESEILGGASYAELDIQAR